MRGANMQRYPIRTRQKTQAYSWPQPRAANDWLGTIVRDHQNVFVGVESTTQSGLGCCSYSRMPVIQRHFNELDLLHMQCRYDLR